ncbi:MAG: hypothetical protein BECKG1743D_GA0114223_108272 [Candidatus Kentron sp. G]|nr:MAG: hypothetical protein BECKG1743E_GA0114224_104755 [Candidatus Kentron sp. G]VFN02299.1 MAG: hypothetical protein BECKG1743F_GA0114225_106712 [Candidatus Kentron sp. G]VFN06200.1 MAG: hypothetical protein BECKG1743D_GA0114223_108272 [Candidatus Kentron sp. G]
MKRICVNCGARSGNDPRYRQMAQRLGRALVRRGCELVYGAGNIGLMGSVADAVLEAGGAAIGVIPTLFRQEITHQGLTERP